MSKTNLTLLLRIRKRAVQLIYNLGFLDHTKPRGDWGMPQCLCMGIHLFYRPYASPLFHSRRFSAMALAPGHSHCRLLATGAQVFSLRTALRTHTLSSHPLAALCLGLELTYGTFARTASAYLVLILARCQAEEWRLSASAWLNCAEPHLLEAQVEGDFFWALVSWPTDFCESKQHSHRSLYSRSDAL